MRLRIVAVMLIPLLTTFAVGQHGYAEGGLYNFNYKGDTWTGEISSLDRAAESLTLSYRHKDKVETFTGVIKPAVHVVNKDDKDVDPAGVRVRIGDRITVYYIRQGSKYPVIDGGKQHDEVAKTNIIFKIKLLD